MESFFNSTKNYFRGMCCFRNYHLNWSPSNISSYKTDMKFMEQTTAALHNRPPHFDVTLNKIIADYILKF